MSGAPEVHYGRQEASRTRRYLTGPETTAEGELRADGFLVMQDSRMRRAHTPSLTTSYVRLRARLKQENIVFDRSGSLLFRENYLFASPSAAASVLLGRNANGLIEWKDAHGVSLRDQVRAVNDG